MNALVLYKSKTGFARKYALWIASALNTTAIESNKFNTNDFSNYDLIIFGGGLYVGGINGVGIIKKNLNILAGKKIIVFASGATPNRAETTTELFNLNFTPQEQKRIHFYYLRGGFDYSKLGLIDKVLMVLLKLKIRSKKESKRSPDEKGMLAAYSEPCDFSKEKYITELIDFARL